MPRWIVSLEMISIDGLDWKCGNVEGRHYPNPEVRKQTSKSTASQVSMTSFLLASQFHNTCFLENSSAKGVLVATCTLKFTYKTLQTPFPPATVRKPYKMRMACSLGRYHSCNSNTFKKCLVYFNLFCFTPPGLTDRQRSWCRTHLPFVGPIAQGMPSIIGIASTELTF